MNDIIWYRKAVEGLAKEKNGLIFRNTGEEHASVVMSTIFKNADKQVRIYANNMNGDISKHGDYIDSLKQYLIFEDNSLHVFLDEFPAIESEVLQVINAHKRDNVVLKTAPKSFVDKANETFENVDNIHFCIGDDIMYRVETDPENHKATCSFNDNEVPDKLSAIFDAHF